MLLIGGWEARHHSSVRSYRARKVRLEASSIAHDRHPVVDDHPAGRRQLVRLRGHSGGVSSHDQACAFELVDEAGQALVVESSANHLQLGETLRQVLGRQRPTLQEEQGERRDHMVGVIVRPRISVFVGGRATDLACHGLPARVMSDLLRADRFTLARPRTAIGR